MMHDLKKRRVTGSYVPGENLHMTLTFIGETDQVDAVKQAVGSVPVPPIRIQLTNAGMFGNLLYVGVRGNQKLKGYVSAVRAVLDRAGISYDKKKFVPHITIVRRAGGNLKNIPVPKADMTAKYVSLMVSETKNGKVRYRTIAKFS